MSALAKYLSRSNAALLVYDMQAGICRQVESETVIAKVGEVVAAARAAGIRIAWCRHQSLPKAWMGSFAMRMAMAWQKTDDPEKVEPWFLRDTPGVAIIPELVPQPEDFVFDKLTMSAFESTPLQIAMRDAGLSALAICGIATEIGIEPTCRHASDLGIVTILIEDACGHGHADAAQRAIEGLRFAGDTIVTDVAGFKTALGSDQK
jgi:nicotinamidase-related amidase